MWFVEQVRQEPVVFQGLIQASLAMVAGFGLVPKLTQDKMGLVLAFSAALLAFLTRRVVTPAANPPENKGAAQVPKN
jgi:hypothetical protein